MTRRYVVVGAMLVMLLLSAWPPPGAAIGAPLSPQLARTAADDAGESVTSSSTSNRPLLLVVDISGSMKDREDGGEVVKLDAAKTALSAVLRQQPRGARVGLWTYPAAGSDCSPGSYVVPIDSESNVNDLAATVNSLEADGGTPTGPAMRAAVDALKAQGIEEATLLLVSDGESNCGTPPCDVAREILAEGFDVTVVAMGFQISEEGRRELQCIADATLGSYHDANDAAQLDDLMQEVAIPQLELKVTSSHSVTSGMSTVFAVEVANPSARDVDGVAVSLSFAGVGLDSIFPAVVPPRYLLGNVPAGERVTRRWTISTSGDATGTASWKIAAWAASAGLTTQTGQISVSAGAAALADAGAILADAGRDGPVVIMGDSYSSGEGGGDYIDGTSEDEADRGREELCHRSPNTYGVSLFGLNNVEIIACSGAVAGNFYSPRSERNQQPQLTVLEDLDKPPSLVLMTLGGNDIGFASIIERCLVGSSCAEDDDFVMDTTYKVWSLGGRLPSVYEDVWVAANSEEFVAAREGSYAPVVVLPYLQVLPHWQRASCHGFSSKEIEFANNLTARLDQVIETAVSKAQARGAGVYYAANVYDAVLPDHTACGPSEPYVHGITVFQASGRWINDLLSNGNSLSELLHPTTEGYANITNALVAWSQGMTPLPEGELEVRAPRLIPVSTARPSATISISPTTAHPPLSVTTARPVDLTVTDMAPNVTVTVTVQSTVRTLASWRVGEDGAAQGLIYLPQDLEPGRHTLTAEGLSATGDWTQIEMTLKVGPVRPWWFWPAISGAVLLLAGGIVLYARGRRAL